MAIWSEPLSGVDEDGGVQSFPNDRGAYGPSPKPTTSGEDLELREYPGIHELPHQIAGKGGKEEAWGVAKDTRVGLLSFPK